MTEAAQTFDSPRLVTPSPASSGGSILEELRAELAREAEDKEEFVTYAVPRRPGYEVRFGTNIPDHSLKAWRQQNKKKGEPLGVDQLRYCATFLANKAQAILRNGEEVCDRDGEPVRFDALYDSSEATTLEAVLRFYKRDADVIKTAGALLIAAGWDGDDLPDPTTAS